MSRASHTPAWDPTKLGGDEYRLWAVHYEGGDTCRAEPSKMSDEHKRQTEYVVRAAEDAGYTTATEVRIPNGTTRPDAVIYGPLDIAVEVQRSPMTAKAAVDRTKRTVAAGMSTSVWLNDREGMTRWFFRVPSIGMNLRTWDEVPLRGTVTVTTGTRRITAQSCREFDRCPETGRGLSCGKFHPAHLPWMGLTVDDVASLVPAGGMVPMRFRRKDVLLVSPNSLDIYEDLAGEKAALAYDPAAEDRRIDNSQRVPCAAAEPITGPNFRYDEAELVDSPARCSRCAAEGAYFRFNGAAMHQVCP